MKRNATAQPAYVVEGFWLYFAIRAVAMVNIMTAPAYPTTVQVICQFTKCSEKKTKKPYA